MIKRLSWEERDKDAYNFALIGIITLMIAGFAFTLKQYPVASFFLIIAIFALQTASNYFSNKKLIEQLSSISQKLDVLIKEVRKHRIKEEKD